MYYSIKYHRLKTNILNYSLWKFLILFFSSINLTFANGNYRENHALRHPCNVINKRLIPYITWTEKLASSQYKVQKDACGQMSSNGPACCTNEVLNSYGSSLDDDLKNLVDTELIHLSRIFAIAKQQTDVWSKEYITESRRLTISSLESLFGTKEYRSNIHHSVSTLFNILGDSSSSVDDVSRSTIDLLNNLIISLYRQFMLNDNIVLDDKFQKCIVNKAFDIEALPTQRELLYILTSGASLFQIFRTMLIYIDADIQRLKARTTTVDPNQCLQRYAREALCPICMSTSSSFNSNNEFLCQNDCQNFIKLCFNQTNNSYVTFASIAKGYATVIKEIEQAIIELKLVERLSKLHIYFYDMVVNATNSRHIYTQLKNACPNSNIKSFSPILSLPPTINERREIVSRWNRSIYYLFKQLHSSIDSLYVKFTQQIITDICSNPKYAVTSNHCTQINKQTTNNLIQWQLPSIPPSTLNINTAEQTRNQVDDLKKKLTPIQQIIISLRPKKKYSLFEYIPDFGSYDDDINNNNNNDDDTQLPSFIDTYDTNIQGSLSERLYREIDGQTTSRTMTTTRRSSSEQKGVISNSQLVTYSTILYLTIFILHQLYIS